MKTCSKCGKSFSDNFSFCDYCGAALAEGNSPYLSNNFQQPVNGQQIAYNQNVNNNVNQYKGDFNSAPVGVNVLSIIGFVLAFLCIGFVWIPNLSIIIFPLAVLSLVLCTIVKARKYENIFAQIGFIVGLVVTIISGIVFSVNMYERFF